MVWIEIVHARDRGAEAWWKSFTTGKSAEHLGGVPHDTYGMTSLGVRQYVIGIYKQLGLREKDITKVQTGGPDGDLGSSAYPILFFCFVLGGWGADAGSLGQMRFCSARIRLSRLLMEVACLLILRG